MYFVKGIYPRNIYLAIYYCILLGYQLRLPLAEVENRSEGVPVLGFMGRHEGDHCVPSPKDNSVRLWPQ